MSPREYSLLTVRLQISHPASALNRNFISDLTNAFLDLIPSYIIWSWVIKSGARTHPEIWNEWLRSRYPHDKRTTLEIFAQGQGLIAPDPFFDPVWYLNTHADVFRRE